MVLQSSALGAIFSAKSQRSMTWKQTNTQREMLGHRIEMTVSLLKKNHGLTLIEILIAMVMGLLVLGAVLNIFVSQNRTNAVQQEVAYAQQSVRQGYSV